MSWGEAVAPRQPRGGAPPPESIGPSAAGAAREPEIDELAEHVAPPIPQDGPNFQASQPQLDVTAANPEAFLRHARRAARKRLGCGA
jgi:hypothetical protein